MRCSAAWRSSLDLQFAEAVVEKAVDCNKIKLLSGADAAAADAGAARRLLLA